MPSRSLAFSSDIHAFGGLFRKFLCRPLAWACCIGQLIDLGPGQLSELPLFSASVFTAALPLPYLKDEAHLLPSSFTSATPPATQGGEAHLFMVAPYFHLICCFLLIFIFIRQTIRTHENNYKMKGCGLV